MKALVTGASGFIGSFLLSQFKDSNEISLRPVYRNDNHLAYKKKILIENIDSNTNWNSALEGIDSVIHLAGRAHFLKKTSSNSSTEFKSINIDGTANLANQAASAGVKRFLYLSSIKVNGEETFPGEPFKPDNEPSPVDEYGKSKLEAERQLINISTKTEMDFVIIRPVMVYGPGVKGNLLSLLKWISRGLPLPLGSTKNLRDLVSVHNLVDLIFLCLTHPSAANQIFCVSDDEPISTSYLVNKMSKSFDRSIINFPISPYLLKILLQLINRSDISQKLISSLEVDIKKTKELLDWEPTYSFDEAINSTVSCFLANSKKDK